MNIKIKSLFIFSLILCVITSLFYIFFTPTGNHALAKNEISTINFINVKIAESIIKENDYSNMLKVIQEIPFPSYMIRSNGLFNSYKHKMHIGTNKDIKTYEIISSIPRSSCPFIIKEMKNNQRLLKITLLPLNEEYIQSLKKDQIKNPENVEKFLKTVYKNKKSISDNGILNICKKAENFIYTFTFSDFIDEVK